MHWSLERIGDVCLINPRPSEQDFYPDDLEVQFLPMKLVEEATGKIHLTEIRRYDEVKKGYTAIKDDDILFAKVTPCMENGKIAIASKLKNGIGFGSTEFHVLRPVKEIFNKYIFFFLVRKSFRHLAASKMTGAVGLRRVPKQFLEDYQIPVAPLSEQMAIVSKIEELFSELDKGIEQLKTAQQQLKVYRQAVLKYAFEGKLTNKEVKEGELPVGWVWKHLHELAKLINGDRGKNYPNRNEYVVNGIPFINTGHIEPNGKLDIHSMNYITRQKFDSLNSGKVKAGDLIYCLRGATMGKTAIIDQFTEGAIASSLVIVRVDDQAYYKYIYYYLISPFGKDNIKEFDNGTAQPNLSAKSLSLYQIPVTSIREQNQVVQEIESRLSVCDKLEETIANSLTQAEALRQSILKKAFEGRLLSENELEGVHNIAIGQLDPSELPIAAEPKVAYKRKGRQSQIHFPKVIEGITTTDLHAGILAMIIEAHASPEHQPKLSHVKGEKIAHLVEAHIGIDLGRVPKKDAAGPDDYPHLKKVESRANKANWFGVKKLKIGHTYVAKPGLPRIIGKVKDVLPSEELQKIESLIHTFLPFELEHAEVIATVYAAWNNLLLEGKNPTDEEIVYESRENWSERKLKIQREKFFKALKWMKEHSLVPEGRGKNLP